MSIHTLKFNVRPIERARVPVFLGHKIRGAFLAILRDTVPELAASLHEGTSLRNYAVTSLLPEGKRHLPRGRELHLGPERRMCFCVNLLGSQLGQGVLESLLSLMEIKFQLGVIKLLLEYVEVKVIPLQELLQSESRGLPKIVIMEFLSPTQFSSRGSKQPMKLFPDPRYIFGNLIGIWNRLAGETAFIDREGLISWINDDVYANYYSLHTRLVNLGKSIPLVGFVGRTEFVVRDSGNPHQKWLVPLLRLARFSNVGNKRTAGMGVVDTQFVWR